MIRSCENLFINKLDEYYNINDFESGKTNILFITGFSGSGKSTLGKVLSQKYKCDIIELDDIMCPELYSDIVIKSNDILNGFFKNNFYAKMHRNEHKNYKLAEEFINYIIENPPKRKLIVEGVQLWLSINSKDNIIEYDKIVKYPIIFKGTAGLLSTFRALHRDKYKSTLYKIAHKYTYIFSDNVCIEKLRAMVKKENESYMNSNEGAVYSSSIGILDDETGIEVKSMDFGDLMNETSTESKKEDDKCYIFIRNVESKYKNPLVPTNILDKGIKLVDEKTKDGFFNHSTISYTLKDGFVGLTLDSNIHKAKLEYVTDTSKNTYTSTVDSSKAKYTVYRLEVTKEQYENIKRMIDYSLRSIKLDYSVISNFFIGLKLIKNKLSFNKKSQESANKFDNFKFVCSSFVAYILSKCVPSVKEKFSETDILSMTPNGIVNSIPGLKHSFSGIWKDYNRDLSKYVSKHPELVKYTK